MNLKDKINEDFKSAFKAKEEARLSVLKMLKSELGNAELAKRAKSGEAKDIALTDEEVLAVVAREAKKRKDSIEMFEKGGRPELAESEKNELQILSAYLPEQIPETELRELVKKAIEQSGAKEVKETGKIMAVLMPNIKGRADGALVNKIIREILGV